MYHLHNQKKFGRTMHWSQYLSMYACNICRPSTNAPEKHGCSRNCASAKNLDEWLIVQTFKHRAQGFCVQLAIIPRLPGSWQRVTAIYSAYMQLRVIGFYMWKFSLKILQSTPAHYSIMYSSYCWGFFEADSLESSNCGVLIPTNQSRQVIDYSDCKSFQQIRRES